VLFAGVGVLAAALAVAADAGQVLRSVESASVDTRFSIRGSTGQPRDVVVVGVDEATFIAFENHLQWPFPRRYHAKVIDRISAGDPKAIAIDIQFTEPTNATDDGALLEAVARAQNVVLGAAQVDKNGNTNVFGGASVIQRVGAEVGSSLFPIDPDHVIRRVRESVGGLTAFAIAAAAVAEGEPVPRARGGSHWIDFAGPPGTVKSYSYSDVYLGKVPSSAFRDKVVVLGTSDPVLHDIHPTSTGDMAGPEIQANAIGSALRGYPLRSAPVWLNVLLIVLLAVIPLAGIRLGVVSTLVVVVAAGMVLAVVAQVAFVADRVIAFTYPLLALAVSTFGVLVIWARAGQQAATMSDNER
jgi:CHASE2 domain-containing sensor protein